MPILQTILTVSDDDADDDIYDAIDEIRVLSLRED